MCVCGKHACRRPVPTAGSFFHVFVHYIYYFSIDLCVCVVGREGGNWGRRKESVHSASRTMIASPACDC